MNATTTERARFFELLSRVGALRWELGQAETRGDEAEIQRVAGLLLVTLTEASKAADRYFAIRE